MDASFFIFTMSLPRSGVVSRQTPKMAFRFYVLLGIVWRRHHGKDPVKCALIIFPVNIEEA